jgi:hypothetical protein
MTGSSRGPVEGVVQFSESGASAGSKAYIVGADGSSLRQLSGSRGDIENSVWSPDQKSAYVGAVETATVISTVWRENAEGSTSEKFVDNCGFVSDADPSGQYLLGVVLWGEKTGIYEVSISDRKCILLLPGVATETAYFSRDGKSFLYAVASRGEVTVFRQPWRDGKINGAAQVALKVPFAFPLFNGNGGAYDFSRDLSTIVYARPGGHADLYLLSQK